MKVDELRVLEIDELDVRLKTARRELYELRFKHAVGQLDNSAAISKVRHDIARIMTVLQERDLGIVVAAPAAEAEPIDGEPEAEAASEEPVEAMPEEPVKSRRGRKQAEDAS